jgi:hypothetical protein
MNRNQKIALGCGGAGCLGLIVVCVAGVLVYAFMGRSSGSSARNNNYNYNSNRASRDATSNVNDNSDSNENAKTATNSPSSESSSFSSDEKHRLFQAAGMVGDSATVTKVLKKIGLMSEDGTPTSEYSSFIKDHFSWALRNTEFIQSVNSKEKAQAYLDEHLGDS